MTLDEQGFHFQVTGALEVVSVCWHLRTAFAGLQEHSSTPLFLKPECPPSNKDYKLWAVQVQQAEQSINGTKYHLDYHFLKILLYIKTMLKLQFTYLSKFLPRLAREKEKKRCKVKKKEDCHSSEYSSPAPCNRYRNTDRSGGNETQKWSQFSAGQINLRQH